MEYRSRRLQNVKSSFKIPPTTSPQLQKLNPLAQLQTQKEHQYQLSQEQDNKSQLVIWWYRLHALYAFISSCWYWLSECLLHPSHRKENINKSGCENEPNSHAAQQLVVPSSILFSSDSELDSSLEGSEVLQNSEGKVVDDLDDYEFPLVKTIDNLIYFYQLYKTNHSAFVEEISNKFLDRGSVPHGVGNGRASYGHNLNPPEKRPKFLKRGIEFFKTCKVKARRMTRVTGDAHKGWILRVALASRLIIFFIQFSATNLPKAFKHENDGFRFTPESSYGKLLDPFVNSTLGGYVNWDAHYFLHISVYGYTTESILAFFPLLPMTLFLPSRITYFLLSPIISLSSLVVFWGFILNTVLFVKCAGNIYELAGKLSKGPREFVTTACLIFCFNPASIFFSGLYTETLFAYLTSKVILSLSTREIWTAILCAASSSLCRSNGILNAGLIVAFFLQRELCRKDKPFKLFSFGARSVLVVAFCLTPFILFQVHGAQIFCQEGKLFDPNNVPLYCSLTSNVPFIARTLPYSYIQKKYWNVGFLQYFQLKQLPNFILAAPVLYVLGSESLFTLTDTIFRMKIEKTLHGVYDVAQACHGLFLCLFCFFFVHVQVSTRMILSACPYLYIYLADSHQDQIAKFRNSEIAYPIRSLFVTSWCILYYIVGSIGFSLGLPWT